MSDTAKKVNALVKKFVALPLFVASFPLLASEGSPGEQPPASNTQVRTRPAILENSWKGRAIGLESRLPTTFLDGFHRVADKAAQDILSTFKDHIDQFNDEQEAQATFVLIEKHVKRSDYSQISPTIISFAGITYRIAYDESLQAVVTLKEKSEDLMRYEIAFAKLRIETKSSDPDTYVAALSGAVKQAHKDQVSAEELRTYEKRTVKFEFYPAEKFTKVY